MQPKDEGIDRPLNIFEITEHTVHVVWDARPAVTGISCTVILAYPNRREYRHLPKNGVGILDVSVEHFDRIIHKYKLTVNLTEDEIAQYLALRSAIMKRAEEVLVAA